MTTFDREYLNGSGIFYGFDIKPFNDAGAKEVADNWASQSNLATALAIADTFTLSIDPLGQFIWTLKDNIQTMIAKDGTVTVGEWIWEMDFFGNRTSGQWKNFRTDDGKSAARRYNEKIASEVVVPGEQPKRPVDLTTLVSPWTMALYLTKECGLAGKGLCTRVFNEDKFLVKFAENYDKGLDKFFHRETPKPEVI